MIDAAARIDVSEAKKTLELTTRNFRDTCRRGMSMTAGMVSAQTRKNVDAGETRPYFQRRKVGLLKSYYKLSNRLSFKWSGTDTIVARTQAKVSRDTEMAAAIEDGGRYQQFVKEHERRRTEVFGKPANPYTEHVDWFLRFRTENTPKQYMTRAVGQLGDKAGEPLAIALDLLVNERRAPRRGEILERMQW